MILFRYLYKRIGCSILFLLSAFSAILLFVLLMNELKEVGKGHYTLSLALGYCLLQLPAQIYEFFPIILFLSGLFALGDLAVRHELIVMRISGLTRSRFATYLILIAFLCSLSACVLFESITPITQRIANAVKDLSVSRGRFLKQGATVWLKETDYYIYIEDFISKTIFKNVVLYRVNSDQRLISVGTMSWLKRVAGHWQANNYRETKFQANQLQINQSNTRVLPLDLSSAWFQHSANQMIATEMSLFELSERIRQLRTSMVDLYAWRYNLYHRVSQPLASVILLLLSAPFVMGSLRYCRLSVRIIFGLFSGILYHFFCKFCYATGLIYQIEPSVIYLMPLLIFILISSYFWRRYV